MTPKSDIEIVRDCLKWMLSEDSDWENGEIGVGYKFRSKAEEALPALSNLSKQLEQADRATESYKKAFMESQDKACLGHIAELESAKKQLEAAEKVVEAAKLGAFHHNSCPWLHGGICCCAKKELDEALTHLESLGKP